MHLPFGGPFPDQHGVLSAIRPHVLLNFLDFCLTSGKDHCETVISRDFFLMRSKQPQFEDLDDLDVKILSALCEDGRITSTALAERVGLSTSPCWTRVRRMEERGIIERYTAVLNHRELGFSNIVFVEITLDKHDEHVLERFGAALAEMPEVMEAYLVTGDYDYLVKLVVRDTDHYERFLRESLYRVPGIRQSRTTFGIRTLKRSLSVELNKFRP